MQDLASALSRLGVSQLSKMISGHTLELLQALDIKATSSRNLAALAVSQLGPNGVLGSRAIRAELLLHLPKEDAAQLQTSLGLEGDDPYAALTTAQFNRGSRNEGILFNFFDCQESLAEHGIRESRPCSTCSAQHPLFPHQRVAVRRALTYLTREPYRVMLHMPTGSGKTRSAMNIIANQLRESETDDGLVFWLAHTEELCEQAAEEFEKCWYAIGDREISVHRRFGAHKGDLSIDRKEGIVFASIQLMYKRALSNQSGFLDIANRARLIVMDEAHQAIAPTYKHVLDMLCTVGATPILGLSATPGRSTRDLLQDEALRDFFYGHKVTLDVPGYTNPIEYLQATGYLAKVNYVPLRYHPSANLSLTPSELEDIRNGFDLSPRVLERLGTDQQRNLLLINQIVASADEGNQIIVFACSVAHANLLADVLRIKGYAAASITSNTDPHQRASIIEKFRNGYEYQILSNFGVLTTGFDAPRTNVAFIARPTQSVVLYSQMIGRVARGSRAGGNDECTVFTVQEDIPGFRSLSEGFEYWNDIWDGDI